MTPFNPVPFISRLLRLRTRSYSIATVMMELFKTKSFATDLQLHVPYGREQIGIRCNECEGDPKQ